VAAAFGKAVEHMPLGQRVLADGVSHSPTVGRLPKERRHYRLPVVGPVLVEMGRGVARLQQPLLRYNRLGHWGVLPLVLASGCSRTAGAFCCLYYRNLYTVLSCLSQVLSQYFK
jgi:hypothetical protein